MLAIAPFDKRGDVSFILDKNKVDEAKERMRVEQARYVGEDNKGQKFVIVADRAVQQSSNVPVVMIEGMRARLNLARGPLSIAALKGRYDLEQEEVLVDGPVRVVGPDGYRLATRDVRVDLDKRTMQSRGPVNGTMPLGQFQAGQPQRRPRRADGAAERRRALENQSGGGQMKRHENQADPSAFAGLPRPLLGAGLAMAQDGISALKGHDSKAPIDITADRGEAQDRADRAIFAGNVVVKQGELTLAHRAADAWPMPTRTGSTSTASTPAAE